MRVLEESWDIDVSVCDQGLLGSTVGFEFSGLHNTLGSYVHVPRQPGCRVPGLKVWSGRVWGSRA